MERLHFGDKTSYSAVEAAIHVSRYALAKPFCAGRKVLDAACGEGYGSFLMSRWGASSVDGVDISRDAIALARRRFAQDNVHYHLGDVTALTRFFADNTFDVVVSLETIEHVREPETFLAEIKRVAKPDAVIIISCPNDHWYYREEGANPFHLNRYHLSEFKRMTERVLGPASSWGLGSLATGFSVTDARERIEAEGAEGQAALARAREVPTALQVPSMPWHGPTPENCSFFVGAWGPSADLACSVVYPLSMDEADRPPFGGPKLAESQAFIEELKTALAARDKRVSELEGALAARDARTVELEAEGEKIKEELASRGERVSELEDALAARDKHVAELEAFKASAAERLQRQSDLPQTLRETSIRLQAALAEGTALRQRTLQFKERVAALEREVAGGAEAGRRVELEQQISDLRRALAAAESEKGQLSELTAAVPWRVVGVYRKMRPFIPGSFLRFGAYLIGQRQAHRR